MGASWVDTVRIMKEGSTMVYTVMKPDSDSNFAHYEPTRKSQ